MRLVPTACVFLLAACGPGRTDVFAPDPPSQQAFDAVAVGQLQVTWRNPRDADFAATMLTRVLARGARPEAHATPKAGDPFGGGAVLYVGAGTSFLDTRPPAGCTPFLYQLWAQDRAGNWSAGPAELEVPGGAAMEAGLVAPTAVTAAAVDGDVQLAWTNPPAGFVEVRVVRKAGASAPVTPDDGVPIYRGPDAAAAEPLAGLAPGPWTYGVFACNACNCTAKPASVRFTAAGGADAGTDAGTPDPDAGTPGPLTPTDLTLQLSGDGKNVLLSWNVPPDVTSVKVLRTVNAQALGPGDGNAVLVFQGMGTNAAEKTDRLTAHTLSAPQVNYYRVYGCKNASCETVGVGKTFSLTVAQALKGGGYTLFWRHATANVCADQTQLGPANNTTQPNWWRSCDKNCTSAFARQVDSVNAPNETATTHTAFATRGFTVGRVLSSEFCRAMETAQGFNFGPPIEQSQVLTYFVYDEAQRCVNTLGLLNVVPAAGTNTALISHAGFTCATLDSLAWGEAAIYKPNPTGAAKLIARVPWNGWTTLP